MRRKFDFPKAASALQSSFTVGASIVQVASPRDYRAEIAICNNGAEVAYILYSESAASSDGLPLSPSSLFREEKWNGPVYAIASGSTELRVVELL